MRRFGTVAFAVLAVVTVAAFFITQHLKVATPLINGKPAPSPSVINPVDGQVCRGKSHKRMFISFYLQNQSDDVTVAIVDSGGDTVDTIGNNVHMTGGRHPVRRGFTWNGRLANGSVAPDGVYYIRVTLIHQGRSVLISNSSGALPVTVETSPPRPKVTAVAPGLIPQTGIGGATVQYTGTRGLAGRMLVYRTDLPGAPKLVKAFRARPDGRTVWDGTVAGGAPAPQGTYLIGLRVTDRACNTGSFPPALPPVAGTTPHAGVTVRYLAGQPPLTPVAPAASATVFVDARQHGYAWALRPAGYPRHLLAAGGARSVTLRVPLSGRPPGTGLYELALRYGAHRTVDPIVGPVPGGGAAKVLVVVPALTWQGANPVDDDGDGIPNTLTGGDSVLLARPLVDGLPAGWGDLIALLQYLKHNHLPYQLTTDLGLVTGIGPRLAGHAGVILAGDERWVPPSLAASLRNYVTGGGHLLSLGIDALRRGVTLGRTVASQPTPPRATDIFGVRVGVLTATGGSFILAGHDGLGLFKNTSGAFHAFRTFQAFTGVTAPATLVSSAGTTSSSSAIIGLRLGRGAVVEMGIPGFAAALRHSSDAQEIFGRMWSLLTR